MFHSPPVLTSRFRFRASVIGLLMAFVVLFGLLSFPPAENSAYAAGMRGFTPNTYKNGYRYGSGVYFAPHDVVLHEDPSETSPVVESFHWSPQDAGGFGGSLVLQSTNRQIPLRNAFICYYPDFEVAMMAVTGESAGWLADGAENTDPEAPVTWVEVIYDQKAQKTGWVKLRGNSDADDDHLVVASSSQQVAKGAFKDHFGVYQSWIDFMKLNAKPLGVYFLDGVSNYQRSIRTKDQDEASLIQTVMIRDMKVRHVRGNWLLVEVVDFERNTPIGWVRWRDDEGNLMVFPNLSQEKPPVVITGQ